MVLYNFNNQAALCANTYTGGSPPVSEVCPATTASLSLLLYLLNDLININSNIGDPCNRVNSVNEPRSEYDFVVIGGGAAGSAVAARLSEVPEWNVLLIEAGPDEPAGAEIPSNLGVYIGSSIDWNFKTSNEKSACLQTNGSCTWPRGRNLGGTTVHHGMAYHRGNPTDYKNWVEMGADGWSYEDVLPYFMKSENNMETDRVGSKIHAVGGPVTVERFPWQPSFAQVILDAARETGYGVTEDMVGEKLLGFTIAQTMSKNGVRQSAAAAFLRPVRDRENLDILLNATATKILTDGQKVVGVEYVSDGKTNSVKVSKEVVVSGGAVNSPQLLLLSGIGPEDDLKSLGIPLVANLPGVGQNVHNHVSYKLDFIMSEDYEEDFRFDPVSQYIFNQTGPMSSTGLAQITAILASKYTTPDYPDIQIFFSGFQAACRNNVDLSTVDNKRTVRFTSVNLHPKSRGTLTLASSDPLEHPIIWSNDLGEPEDVDVLVEGLHVLLNMANSTAMKATGLKLVTEPLKECSEHEFLSDDYFRCAVHIDTRTENHQGGSCKMGSSSDPLAVVDERLSVYGVKGLRVADASIVPKMISGNPHATITMIGERAADFIKQDYDK